MNMRALERDEITGTDTDTDTDAKAYAYPYTVAPDLPSEKLTDCLLTPTNYQTQYSTRWK